MAFESCAQVTQPTPVVAMPSRAQIPKIDRPTTPRLLVPATLV